MNLGIFGYGQMGAVMVTAFLAKGHAVAVNDIDPERCSLAKQAGCFSEAVDVGEREVIILALRDPDDVLAVADALSRPNTLVIDTTSIDPTTAMRVEEKLQGRGITYVESPILGGPPQVGRWIFLFGGDTLSVRRASTILAPLGDGEHFGEIGRGSEAKLLNNILTGIHAAAIGEVVRVAMHRNMNVAALQHAIMRSESAGRNPVLDIRVPKILNGTLLDTFSIDNETKDLNLALNVFGDDDALQLTRATYDVYRRAQHNGWGKRDIGRLYEAVDGGYPGTSS